MKKDGFINKQQELFWKAFSGRCGEEFAGNPFLIEAYVELENARRGKEDLLNRANREK